MLAKTSSDFERNHDPFLKEGGNFFENEIFGDKKTGDFVQKDFLETRQTNFSHKTPKERQ